MMKHLAIFINVLCSCTAIKINLPERVVITFDAPQRAGSGEGSAYITDPSITELYLSTLRDTLTGTALQTPGIVPGEGTSPTRKPFDDTARNAGTEWCESCYTMAGNARLSNVRKLLEQTISDKVPGDFVETGIWRGGTSIYARAVQRVLGEGGSRRVYGCDSFSGLPKASNTLDDDHWSQMDYLSVSTDEVRDHFERFQMLDKGVKFVKGFFSYSLPILRDHLKDEGRQISVLRGDGDMFESYYDILFNLYEFVPVGGYFICDDCPAIQAAENAIQKFRGHHGITEEISRVAGSGMGTFWRKTKAAPVDYEYYLKWNATRRFD